MVEMDMVGEAAQVDLEDQVMEDQVMEDQAMEDQAMEDKAMEDQAMEDKVMEDQVWGIRAQVTFHSRMPIVQVQRSS